MARGGRTLGAAGFGEKRRGVCRRPGEKQRRGDKTKERKEGRCKAKTSQSVPSLGIGYNVAIPVCTVGATISRVFSGLELATDVKSSSTTLLAGTMRPAIPGVRTLSWTRVIPRVQRQTRGVQIRATPSAEPTVNGDHLPLATTPNSAESRGMIAHWSPLQ